MRISETPERNQEIFINNSQCLADSAKVESTEIDKMIIEEEVSKYYSLQY